MRSETSSFVEEVARRTWSDAKRKPAAETISFGDARTIETNRKDLRHLSPAEAAAEIRRNFQDRKANLNYSRQSTDGGPKSEEMKSAILEAAERKWAEISGRGKRRQASVPTPPARYESSSAASSSAGAAAAAAGDMQSAVAGRPEPVPRQGAHSRASKDGAWEAARRTTPSDSRVTVTAEVAGGQGAGGWLPGVGRWSAPSQLDEVILGVGPEDLPPSPPRRSLRSRDSPAPRAVSAAASGLGDRSDSARGFRGGCGAADGGTGWPRTTPFPPSVIDTKQRMQHLRHTAPAAQPSFGVTNGGKMQWAEDGSDATAFARDEADGQEGDGGSGSNQLREREVELLLRVSGERGKEAQDIAADELRALLHDRGAANALGKDRWALEALARPLLDGSERARVSCCACLRHIALSEEGAAAMGRSQLVLRSLVVAMQDGGDAARQKAAAALGNLAWRSETNRRAVAAAGGAIDGLLELLRQGSSRCRESALAALSNVTLHGPSTAAVLGRPGAVEALAGELLHGTPKGQLRAAGILRNLAIEEGNRPLLHCCSALRPALEQAAKQAAGEEARQRAGFALQLLAGQIDAGRVNSEFPGHILIGEPPDSSGTADLRWQHSGLDSESLSQGAEHFKPRFESVTAPTLHDWKEITGKDSKSSEGGSGGLAAVRESAIYEGSADRSQLDRVNGATSREANRSSRISDVGASLAVRQAARDRTIDEEAADAEAEAEALERLGLWLRRNGWGAVQERLFDLGETRYGRYARIEPDMVSLDEARGLYLWRGRTLRLVGPDRYNPLLLVDTASREVIWDWESETTFAHPWARRYLVCRAEGGTTQVLLRRTGAPVATSPPIAAGPTGGPGVISETPVTISAELQNSSPQRRASDSASRLPVRETVLEIKQREENLGVTRHSGPKGAGPQEDLPKSVILDQIQVDSIRSDSSPTPAENISPTAPGPVPRPEPPSLSLAGRSLPQTVGTTSLSPSRETDGAGLELVLDMDFEGIAAPGKQRTFRATLVRDLSAAAGSGAHRLSIVSVRPADPVLRPGGVEAVVEVLPPAAGDEDRRSADMLVMELVAQASRSDSFLLAGQISALLLLIRPGQRGVSSSLRQTLHPTQTLGSRIGAGSASLSVARAFLQGVHLGESGQALKSSHSAAEFAVTTSSIEPAGSLAERTSPGSVPSLSVSRLPESESSTDKPLVAEIASTVATKTAVDVAAADTENAAESGTSLARPTMAVRMTLDLDFSKIRNLPFNLPQFRSELQRDLAAAAGLELRQVVIGAVAAEDCLAVVDFEVESSGSGSSWVGHNEKNAAAVRELQYQCADPQSLLRTGKHTCRVTSLVPINASSSPVAVMAPVGTGAAALRAATDEEGCLLCSGSSMVGLPAGTVGEDKAGILHHSIHSKTEPQNVSKLGNGSAINGDGSGSGSGRGGGISVNVNDLIERTVSSGSVMGDGQSAKPASHRASSLQSSPPTTPAPSIQPSLSSSSSLTLTNALGFATPDLAKKAEVGINPATRQNGPTVTSIPASLVNSLSTGELGNTSGAITHNSGADPAAPVHKTGQNSLQSNEDIPVSRSNPQLWRRLMTEGEGNEAGEILFGKRLLRGPSYDEAGLASILDSETGSLFYQGPGRQEVFLPPADAISTLAAAGFGRLVEWCKTNGWHDLQRRLLDAGRTDFASYTRYEQEMRAAPDDVPGLFVWRRRRLRLVGQSRWEPQRLLDEGTGEVLWDRVASTVPLYPWARESIMLERRTFHAGGGEDRVRIVDRKSGRLLLELEYAAFRDIPLRRTLLPVSPVTPVTSAAVFGSTSSSATTSKVSGYGYINGSNIPEATGINSDPGVLVSSFNTAEAPLAPLIRQVGSHSSLAFGNLTSSARGSTNPQSNGRPQGHSSNGLGSEVSKPKSLKGANVAGPMHSVVEAHPKAQAADNNELRTRDAILCLREWTAEKGWYELKKRLFNAGETDYRAYATIEPGMRPIEGRSGAGGEILYSYRGRTLGLVGQKMDPHRLWDINTGEVLWDFEKSTTFTYPWARAHFVLRPKNSSSGRGNSGNGRFQIVNRGTGTVVVEYGAPPSGCPPEASPLLLQAILMEAVPLVESLGLQALVAEGLEVVQVIKDYDPSPAEKNKGQGSSQLLLHCGDLVQVLQHGRQGWNLGRIWKGRAGEGQSQSTDGNEGWFPSTYAAPVHELATWRGRLIRISSREEIGQAHVIVGDIESGTVVFRGPAEVPSIDWMAPWDSESNDGESSSAGGSPRALSVWSPHTSQSSGQVVTAAARAAWATNRASFESCVSRRYSCLFKSNPIGQKHSESLELKADGSFIAETQMGQTGILLFKGTYKALPRSDPDIIILRIESTTLAGNEGLGQQLQEEDVFLRSQLTSLGGRLSAAEWVSGHEGLGFGAVGSLLAENSGQAPSSMAPIAPPGPPGTWRRG